MDASIRKEKIREWYAQSLHEQFNPFIKLWISFNGWYKVKFREAVTDKKAIEACKRDAELLTYYHRSFSDRQFCDYLNRLGFELERKPLENLTRPRDKKLTLSKLEDENGEVNFLDNSTEALKDYFDVIYRVRCNLFHCENSPNNDRHKLIVECAYKTLSIIMKQIIDTFEGV